MIQDDIMLTDNAGHWCKSSKLKVNAVLKQILCSGRNVSGEIIKH